MIHELNRKGKAAGAGFYEYPENGKNICGMDSAVGRKPMIFLNKI
jgi:hypothetical protein